MGKKGNKRKTRWRVLPIGGDDADCLYTTNEDDCEAEPAPPSTAAYGPGSYARAAQLARGKPGPKPRPSPSFCRPYRSLQAAECRQPLVTAEKKTFNEEEYTKITTPRQDVLFKKGYLGRKKTGASTALGSAAPATAATATATTNTTTARATGTPVSGAATGNSIELAPMHNGGDCEVPVGDPEPLSPADDQMQYIYSNGYVDGVIYVNGGYDWYDPYGNVAVVVGPPPFAAVPCQPLPLQPIEWFNPSYGVPFVAPPPAPCARAGERANLKRCSGDSQNCSPQSSESTDPPGSPQEGEGDEEGDHYGDGESYGDGYGDRDGNGEGDCDGEMESGMLQALPIVMNGTDEYGVYPNGQPVQSHGPPHSPAYIYPGAYMFGQTIYSMNGITVQSTSQLPQNTDNSGSKKRKKKRRRRRRRGGVDDGSEESSSDEKDLEEPVSLTSQESSPEVESDSKNSAGSENCPTNVGYPELPERTQKSPSSFPSISPSLSPSPSLLNATDNKTALPKVNYIDSNAQLDTINVRSDGNIDCKDKSESISSVLRSEDNHIPNNEKVRDVCKTIGKHILTSYLLYSSGSNADPTSVVDISKTNSNCHINNGISLDLDNNSLVTENCIETVFDKSESVHNELNDCIIKNLTPLSMQKSKGKKGLKVNKKTHYVQDDFSGFQSIDHSLKSQDLALEMDGHEKDTDIQEKYPSNNSQTQSSGKETKDLEGKNNEKHQEENANKNKPDSPLELLNTSELPEKPIRKYHHRQNLNLHSTKSVVALQEDTETLSLLPEDQIVKEDTCVTSSAPVLQNAFLQHEGNFFSKIENNTSTSTITTASENTKTLEKEALCSLTTPSETMHSKERDGKESSNVPVQETSYVTNKFFADSQEYDQRDLGSLPNPNDLCISKLEEGSSCIDDSHETNKSEVQKSTLNIVEKDISVPPIPPPRRKKYQPSKKGLIERPPTPGKELEIKKQKEISDDCLSSSSRESEESVINLWSSSLKDKNKEQKEFLHKLGVIESDENMTPNLTSTLKESNIIFKNESSTENQIQHIKLSNKVEEAQKAMDSSKLHESIKCIAQQTQQDLKGDQSQQNTSVTKCESVLGEGSAFDDSINADEMETNYVTKPYDDNQACHLLDEELSSASTNLNKQHQPSLSLTEAVTQWLYSQDSEVLQVPQLVVTEYDTEDLEDASEEEIVIAGPKNVHRNPLLALSCKLENVHDDAGIRVANLEKNITPYSREETSLHEIKARPDAMTSNIFGEFDGKITSKNHVNDEQEKMSQGMVDGISDHVDYSYLSEISGGTDRVRETRSEDWMRRLDEESEEYDADWECDPISLKHSPLIVLKDDQESQLSLEYSEYKCSDMCDPTLSVAKYYSLGLPPEKFTGIKDVTSDFESASDAGSEGMDALIHFRNELEQHLLPLQEGENSHSQIHPLCSTLQCPANIWISGKMNSLKKCEEMYDSSYDSFTSDSGIQSEALCYEDCHSMRDNYSKSFMGMRNKKQKLSILSSHLGTDSPFPCGGICCILQ